MLKSTIEKYLRNSLLLSLNHYYTTQTAAPIKVATRKTTNVLAGPLLSDAVPATIPFHLLLVLFALPIELGLFPLSLPAPPSLFASPADICVSIGNVSVMVGCNGHSSQINILVVNPGGVMALIYSPE
jgi:hypothetical protein